MIETNWVTKVVGLLGAINLVLISFDAYHLDDNQFTAVVGVISAIAALAGVWYPHIKAAKDK